MEINFCKSRLVFDNKRYSYRSFTFSGLVIAGFGLATWKKQIKGSKEFEAVHNLHFAMLKLREAIKHVRNPAIWPSESQRAVKFIKERSPEKIR